MRPASTNLLRIAPAALALALAAGADVPRPIRLKGRALLASGRPAASAAVWLGRSGTAGPVFAETRAGSDGRFSLDIEHPPVEGVVGAHVPGGGMAWRRVSLAGSGPPAEVILKLAPATLRGRVLRADGRPAVGAALLIAALAPGGTEAQDSRLREDAALLTPPALLRRLATRTDRDGRFRLAGFPGGSLCRLSVARPLQMAPGSPELLRFPARGEHVLGHLVVVEAGSIQVRGETPGGEPLAGAQIHLRPVSTPGGAGAPPELLRYRRLRDTPHPPALSLDARGLASQEELTPGRYELACAGRSYAVTVAEDETAIVRITARAESLQVRLSRADGAPAAGARVAVELPDAVRNWPPGPQGTMTADRGGVVSVPGFPWSADRARIIAADGDAGAVWTGAPSELRSPLALTLRPNHFVSVRGRLVLPDGKPPVNLTFVLLTPEETGARPLALATTDDAGRFRVQGLSRGVPWFAAVPKESSPLESDLRRTPGEAAEQDAGDIRVRPVAERRTTAGRLARAFTPLPAPRAAELAAARTAAGEFIAAARRGDSAELRPLLSAASEGYPEAAEPVLRHVNLSAPPEVGAAGARFLLTVPRLLLRALMGIDPASPAGDQAEPAFDRPEWLIFGARGAGSVRPLFILHRDPDRWRVVNGFLDPTQVVSVRPGDDELLTLPAPAVPAAPVAEAARRFLSLWSAKGAAAGPDLLPHLSSRAVESCPAEGADRRWRQRMDGGEPPRGVSPGKLAPVAHLSAWDLAVLATQPRMQEDIRRGRNRTPFPSDGFPLPQVRAGGVAVLRFEAAGGRACLIVLCREAGKWQVLAPAIPLTLAQEEEP